MKAAPASKPAAASRTAASSASVAAKPMGAASKAATAAASAAAKAPSAAFPSKAAIASIPTRAVAASAAKKSVVPASSKFGAKSPGPAATTGKQQPRLPAIAAANAATAAVSAVSVVPLAPSSQQLIEQQELAAVAAAESAAKHARHNGLVTLRYNHYKESFTIADGVLSAAAIDEKFTLSFAFPKSTLYLTAERPDSYEDFSRPLERKADANTFVELQVGREYFGATFCQIFSRAIFTFYVVFSPSNQYNLHWASLFLIL